MAAARDRRVVPLRRESQVVIRDPAGWERRTLSPALAGVQVELVRLTLDPGASAGPFQPHAPGTLEYATVDEGQVELTIDGERHLLEAGDAIYYAGDSSHAFFNPLDTRSSCLIVMALR